MKKLNYAAEHLSISEAIAEVERGNISYLPSAFYGFSSSDKHMVKRAGQAVGKILAGYSISGITGLLNKLRHQTSMEWYIRWENVDLKLKKGWFETEEDYRWTLIAGVFHPNGYFREKCLCELALYENSLPYLILRMNDWVPAVRRTAGRLSGERARICPLPELFLASPAVLRVKWSERRRLSELNTIEEIIKERLQREMWNIDPDTVKKYEFSVRKSLYSLLFSRKLLEKSQADFLLSQEKSSFCQQIIITGILKHYHCSMEEVEAYLLHKNFCVRKRAMEYKYQLLKTAWPGLEKQLLDKNHGIRQLAGFILRNNTDLDILAFYEAHLSDENPATAIEGIGETGGKEQARLLLPFLTSPREKLVKLALLSYGRLAGSDGEELYWSFLTDGRCSLAKAAYECIRYNKIRYGPRRLYDRIKESTDLCLKKHLVLLILAEDSWKRLPYLMNFYQDPDFHELRWKLAGAMKNRNVYTVLNKTDAEQIEQALKTCEGNLPNGLADSVRFDLKYVLKK